MLGKLFSFFKKKDSRDSSHSDEYLDFSDFTDVNIAGTQRFDQKKLQNKPAQKLSGLSQPKPEKRGSRLEDDKTIIPPIGTEILKNLKDQDETYEGDTGEAQLPEGFNVDVTTPSLSQFQLDADPSDGPENLGATEVDRNLTPDVLKELKRKKDRGRGGVPPKKFGKITSAPHEQVKARSLGEVFRNLFKREEKDLTSMSIQHGNEQFDDSGDKTLYGKHETVLFKVRPEKNANLTRLAIVLLLALTGGALFLTFFSEQEQALTDISTEKKRTVKKPAPKPIEPVKEKPPVPTPKLKKKAISPPPAPIPELEKKPEVINGFEDIDLDDIQDAEEGKAVETPKPVPKVVKTPKEEVPKKRNTLSEDDLIEIENEFSNESSEDSIKSLTDLDVNYLATGTGLVYNCVGKHWACVNKINFLKCKKIAGFNPKRCFPIEWFKTRRGCQLQQIQNINKNKSSSFCY